MIFRGGTSKGLYFLEHDLPQDIAQRDALLLKIMGSPDAKQIDGLGGGTSVTSKVAIVGVSSRADADVDYTFCQVSVDKPLVSTKGNCGNISSGVGPFAIERGLVKVTEPITQVRVFNTNTQKIIVEEVACEHGSVKYDGDFSIAGVPGTASPIKLKFINPAGTLKKRLPAGTELLPTGKSVDILEIPDFGTVQVSIVDAANPLVFVKASDLGLTGKELPRELDANPEKLTLLEKVRGMAAVKLGLCADYKRSAWDTPSIPKMTFVAPAADYISVSGQKISSANIDLLARMMSMQKTHPTYAMTGAMCTAAATIIPGSVVQQVLHTPVSNTIRIAHPDGILEAGVNYTKTDKGTIHIEDTFGFRTANLLAEGIAFC